MSEPRFAGFWTKLYRSNGLARLVLALGVLVRLRQYLANRSLRGDETLIALNLFDRDLAHVVQPLDYSQAAPPAFMQRAFHPRAPVEGRLVKKIAG